MIFMNTANLILGAMFNFDLLLIATFEVSSPTNLVTHENSIYDVNEIDDFEHSFAALMNSDNTLRVKKLSLLSTLLLKEIYSM